MKELFNLQTRFLSRYILRESRSRLLCIRKCIQPWKFIGGPMKLYRLNNKRSQRRVRVRSECRERSASTRIIKHFLLRAWFYVKIFPFYTHVYIHMCICICVYTYIYRYVILLWMIREILRLLRFIKYYVTSCRTSPIWHIRLSFLFLFFSFSSLFTMKFEITMNF